MVVDDQAIVRAGIQLCLLDYADIEVTATVSRGEDAIEICARLHPDVVLVDLMMSGMGGIDTIAALHARAPDVHTVALTGYRDETLVEAALQAGATGYLVKDVAAEDLAKAVRSAHGGVPTLPVSAARATPRPVVEQGRRIGQDLTQQERKVLELLTNGLSNSEIAQRLVVTIATVKFHIRRIQLKLHTSNRTETAILAMRRQLV